MKAEVCPRRFRNQGKAEIVIAVGQFEYAPADLGIKAKQPLPVHPAISEYAPADLGIKAKREISNGLAAV